VEALRCGDILPLGATLEAGGMPRQHAISVPTGPAARVAGWSRFDCSFVNWFTVGEKIWPPVILSLGPRRNSRGRRCMGARDEPQELSSFWTENRIGTAEGLGLELAIRGLYFSHVPVVFS
jgi:hypothetical protein